MNHTCCFTLDGRTLLAGTCSADLVNALGYARAGDCLRAINSGEVFLDFSVIDLDLAAGKPAAGLTLPVRDNQGRSIATIDTITRMDGQLLVTVKLDEAGTSPDSPISCEVVFSLKQHLVHFEGPLANTLRLRNNWQDWVSRVHEDDRETLLSLLTRSLHTEALIIDIRMLGPGGRLHDMRLALQQSVQAGKTTEFSGTLTELKGERQIHLPTLAHVTGVNAINSDLMVAGDMAGLQLVLNRAQSCLARDSRFRATPLLATAEWEGNCSCCGAAETTRKVLSLSFAGRAVSRQELFLLPGALDWPQLFRLIKSCNYHYQLSLNEDNQVSLRLRPEE